MHLNKNTSEIILWLQEVIENEVLGMSTIQSWHKMFLDRKELAEFELQEGKSKTVCTMMNINIIATAIEGDPHQSVQTLTTELKISRESIRQILIGELGMKHVCLA